GWDPARAPAVVGGAVELVVPDGAVLAFKLVRVGPDGVVTWHDGPDRFLLVSGAADPCGAACASTGPDGVARASAAW
ncbi:MAG: hypothetical protein ABMA64_40975, partial [Myxococcota bacterium]